MIERQADWDKQRIKALRRHLGLTQTELASWVATSRESVNKVLRGFRDQGYIQIEEGTIKILDRRGLENFARF